MCKQRFLIRFYTCASVLVPSRDRQMMQKVLQISLLFPELQRELSRRVFWERLKGFCFTFYILLHTVQCVQRRRLLREKNWPLFKAKFLFTRSVRFSYVYLGLINYLISWPFRDHNLAFIARLFLFTARECSSLSCIVFLVAFFIILGLILLNKVQFLFNRIFRKLRIGTFRYLILGFLTISKKSYGNKMFGLG